MATTSTRTSKWNETNFSWPGARVNSCKSEDSDKQLLRMAQVLRYFMQDEKYSKVSESMTVLHIMLLIQLI